MIYLESRAREIFKDKGVEALSDYLGECNPQEVEFLEGVSNEDRASNLALYFIEDIDQLKTTEVLDYDHSHKSTLTSCGLSDEAKLREDTMNMALHYSQKEGSKISHMVEEVEKKFPTRVLAFLATQHILSCYEEAVKASMKDLLKDWLSEEDED